MANMIYEESVQLTKEQILAVVERNLFDELAVLPFNVGENYPDWEFAQGICKQLANHSDSLIRANAIMGFAYIARTKRMLERNVIEPIVLKELRENVPNRGQILDAIEDINLFMGWNIEE